MCTYIYVFISICNDYICRLYNQWEVANQNICTATCNYVSCALQCNSLNHQKIFKVTTFVVVLEQISWMKWSLFFNQMNFTGCYGGENWQPARFLLNDWKWPHPTQQKPVAETRHHMKFQSRHSVLMILGARKLTSKSAMILLKMSSQWTTKIRIPHGLFFVGYLSLSHMFRGYFTPKLTSMFQETGEFPGDHGSS